MYSDVITVGNAYAMAPATVKEFVYAFDRGEDVEPFTFDLEYTCESQ